ncbi:MAG: methylcrotonoyl-CoA carboxylase [Bdellovibrionales bacterium]|nr:methylcrotonoyl-CoA carboxylase [Bdellovibrionales bacterium]
MTGQSISHITALVEQHRALMARAAKPGGDAASEKHTNRGKLLVRHRIDVLLDIGSPFLELSPLAGLDLYDGVEPGAGLVTGIGKIADRLCMIIANDATVKGGTYFPITVKKHIRAQEVASENSLPCIYLVDSGGAFLPLQDEVFPDRFHFGRIFFNQARLSAAGIPQIACVMGSCTAGGAYVPAMSDQVIMVRNQGTVFLGGPPLVKAATGEVVTPEELGGADVHAELSGVSDYTAENDYEAILQIRSLVKHLPENFKVPSRAANVFNAPSTQIDELCREIPADNRKPFPMRLLLSSLLDGSSFDEFKAQYGPTLICGFGTIAGRPVGIVANDGILFSESALKGSHFIQLCCQREVPLLFLQNIVGFMVGREYEHKGIAKNGAKLVNAVASAQVPKITLVVGGSFGAGNYAMCGRAYDPRFLFTWPSSRTAVMGPEQAAQVLTEVKRDSALYRGQSIPENDLNQYKLEITERYSGQANAYYGTARLWDDGVILPEESRRVLELVMEVVTKTPISKTTYGVFRM